MTKSHILFILCGYFSKKIQREFLESLPFRLVRANIRVKQVHIKKENPCEGFPSTAEWVTIAADG